MKNLLFISLLLVLILPVPVIAKPAAAFWHGPFWLDSEQTVEQQSVGGCCFGPPETRVFNPDYLLSQPVAWDADDQIWAGFSGDYMDANTSETIAIKLHADWTTHLIAITSFTPGISITLNLPEVITLTSPSTACIAGPTYKGHSNIYASNTPINAPEDFDYSSLLSEVPNSNGGVAKDITFFATVTNITGKRIKNSRSNPITARVDLVLAGFEFTASKTKCPYPWHSTFTKLYPINSDPQVWVWTSPNLVEKPTRFGESK